jgi:dephospho-CoA kinase
MSRDGITKEMVLNRMRNQWSQQKKMELAEYIVVNDEQSMVIPQLLAIHKLLHDEK